MSEILALIQTQRLATGVEHSAVVGDDTKVYTWGDDQYGQLGRSSKGLMGRDTSKIAKQVPNLINVASIGAGRNHMLASTSEGVVYAWGYGTSGQLGLGILENVDKPILIKSLGDVVAVEAGGNQSFALSDVGNVYSWGLNNRFQLGHSGGTLLVPLPTKIPTVKDVVQLGVSEYHTLALDEFGEVFSWGSNAYLQLGQDEEATDIVQCVIGKVVGMSNVKFISAGCYHNLAVHQHGKVYSWGRGEHGALGTGDTKSRKRATLVEGLKDIVSVSAGNSTSFAVGKDGSVFSWGCNGQHGRLNVRKFRPYGHILSPTAIPKLKCLAHKTSNSHSLAIMTDGRVITWGGEREFEVGVPLRAISVMNVKVDATNFAKKGGADDARRRRRNPLRYLKNKVMKHVPQQTLKEERLDEASRATLRGWVMSLKEQLANTQNDMYFNQQAMAKLKKENREIKRELEESASSEKELKDQIVRLKRQNLALSTRVRSLLEEDRESTVTPNGKYID